MHAFNSLLLKPDRAKLAGGRRRGLRRAAHLLDLRGKAAHPERVHRALDLRRHGGAGGARGARSRAAVGDGCERSVKIN